MKIFSLLVICLILSTATARSETPKQSKQSPKLSIAAAFDLALFSSTAVKEAQSLLRIEEMEKKTAWAAFFPTLDVGANYGLKDQRPSSGAGPQGSQLTLSLEETLYDNGKNWTGLKKAKIELAKAETNLAIVEDQTILDVITGFSTYSLAQKKLEIQKQTLERLKKQLAHNERGYHQGRKTKVDLLRTKAKVKQTHIKINAFNEEVFKATTALHKTLGLDASDPFRIYESIPLKETLVEKDVVVPQLEQTREFGNILREKRLDKLDVNLARRDFWPQVSLTGGVTYDHTRIHNPRGLGGVVKNSTTSQGGLLAWNALVQVEFTVWDWFSSSREVEVAKATEIVEAQKWRLATLTLRETLANLAVEIKRLREEYKINKELVELEKESFAFLERGYRRGVNSFLDLITALDDLSRAEQELYTAYYSLLVALKKASFYKGSLSKSL